MFVFFTSSRLNSNTVPLKDKFSNIKKGEKIENNLECRPVRHLLTFKIILAAAFAALQISDIIALPLGTSSDHLLKIPSDF